MRFKYMIRILIVGSSLDFVPRSLTTPVWIRVLCCVAIVVAAASPQLSRAQDPAPTDATLAPVPPPLDEISARAEPAEVTQTPTANGGRPLRVLGGVVAPMSTSLLYWTPDVSFDGAPIPRGVIVANGAQPGPTLCLTAAVHGDEHNGLEIVRRVLYQVDPTQLSGVVIGVPIVNLDGFRRGTRYLPDRRDLNRYFPGRRQGSAAARLAFSLFDRVISACDDLVDIHTGSFHRTNLPQLRGDLTNLDVLELSRRFGSTVILHNRGAVGTLRRAATDAGIPAVTLETGEPLRVQEHEVQQVVTAIRAAMGALAMIPRDDHATRRGAKRSTAAPDQAPVYFESRWVRVNDGGVLISGVRLGDLVAEGARLGTVTDPVTNQVSDVIAPYSGRVLGMALNQVVLPGYAAFHIGIESTLADAKASDAMNRSFLAPLDTGGPIDDSPNDVTEPRSPEVEVESSE